MKKVIDDSEVLILSYFGYKTFAGPDNEQVLENTLKQMDVLDTQDTANSVSEEDITADNKVNTAPEKASLETDTNIDLILADIVNLNQKKAWILSKDSNWGKKCKKKPIFSASF